MSKKSIFSILCLLLCVTMLATACNGTDTPAQGTEENTTVKTEVSTDPGTTPATKKNVTYTVTIKSRDGGIEGVEFQICNKKGMCAPVKGVTNDEGIAVVTVNAEHYGQDVKVQINKAPEEFGLITDPTSPDNNATFPIENGKTSIEIILEEKIAYTVACNELISGAMKDVEVTLYHKNGDGTKGAVAGTQRTNAEGEAIFYFSEAGSFLIDINAATVPTGYVKSSDAVDLTPTRKRVEIGFVNPNSKNDKTFTVKNADNTPAAGVTVKLYDTGRQFVAEGVTNAAGQVTIRDLSDTTNFSILIVEGGNTLEETDFGRLGASFNATEITVTITDVTQIPDVGYTVKITKKDDNTVIDTNLSVTVFRIDMFGEHIDVATLNLVSGIGEITLKKRDDYFVKLNGMPEGWQISGGNPYAGFIAEQGNTATFVLDDAGKTENDPIIWNNNSTQAEGYSNVVHLTMNVGDVIWIEAQNTEGLMLFIENPNVTVTYNGTTYTAQDGAVSVIFSGGEGAKAKFSVQATANVTLEVRCSTLPGTAGNPYVLTGNQGYETQSIVGEDGGVYFQFTAYRDGLSIEVTGNGATVSINDAEAASTATAEFLNEGETVLILVKPTDPNAESVTITWICTMG